MHMVFLNEILCGKEKYPEICPCLSFGMSVNLQDMVKCRIVLIA